VYTQGKPHRRLAQARLPPVSDVVVVGAGLAGAGRRPVARFCTHSNANLATLIAVDREAHKVVFKLRVSVVATTFHLRVGRAVSGPALNRPLLDPGCHGLVALPWFQAYRAGRLVMAANERAAAYGRARVGQRAPRSVRRAYAFLAGTVTAATWWTWISSDGNAVVSALPVKGPRRRIGTLLPTVMAVTLPGTMITVWPHIAPLAGIIFWIAGGAAIVFQYWRNGPAPLLLLSIRRELLGQLSGASVLEVTSLAANRAGTGGTFRLALESVADRFSITIVAASCNQRTRVFRSSGFQIVKTVSRRGKEYAVLVRHPRS
jgi:hypothetical protein